MSLAAAHHPLSLGLHQSREILLQVEESLAWLMMNDRAAAGGTAALQQIDRLAQRLDDLARAAGALLPELTPEAAIALLPELRLQEIRDLFSPSAPLSPLSSPGDPALRQLPQAGARPADPLF